MHNVTVADLIQFLETLPQQSIIAIDASGSEYKDHWTYFDNEKIEYDHIKCESTQEDRNYDIVVLNLY